MKTLRRYAAAERALAENSIAEHAAGTDHDTPEFLALNREMYDADEAVPWWLRPLANLITWRILRQLGYFGHFSEDGQ